MGSLKCPYCGSVSAVSSPTDAALVEHPFEEAGTGSAPSLSRIAEGALEVACGGCGSTVAFAPPDTAGSCPFCGARIVAQPESADPLLAPDGVLPFQIDRKRAAEAMRVWIRSRWFAPNALKTMARDAGMQGVYLPHWTYDASTATGYVGERGEHYWDTETYTTTDSDGREVERTRQVRRTRWYPASGTVARDFDDVLVPATTSVSADRLAALAPWDLATATPFRGEYLSGFRAQRYQIDPVSGMGTARRIMDGVIDHDVRRDIGGDEQRVWSKDTVFSNVTFKHLLLPVWLAAYRFDGKVYQTMVNARTGEVVGDRPYSVWKIAATVVAGIMVVVAVWWFTREH